MRSILQEAATIVKAIEKAWNEAGRPQEFSVKVFDAGERNFLGFSKRPAVVSLIFEPKREAPKKEIKPVQNGSIQPGYARRQKYDSTAKGDTYQSKGQEREKSKEVREPQKPKTQPVPHPETFIEKQQHPSMKQEEEKKSSFFDHLWTQESIKDIEEWMNKLLQTMDIHTKYKTYTDRHLLKIEFEKPLFESQNDERMLFSSFAYILMQFLKRKYKKRFRGCRLAINVKR